MFSEPAPTPYDLSWSMFGIHVRVSPLFWLGAAFFGWPYLEWGFGYLLMWILCVFVSILLHELGHVVTGMSFGSRGHIVLVMLGGLAIGSSDLRHRWQRVLVLFAGPGVQLVLWAILQLLLLPYLRTGPIDNISDYLLEGIGFLLWINLAWPVLNLLPIWPLDGGRISREFFEWVFGEKGTRAALGISATAAGLLALNCLAVKAGRVIPYLEAFAGGTYMLIFYALLAFGSIQALQQLYAKQRWAQDHRSDTWEDDQDNWRG